MAKFLAIYSSKHTDLEYDIFISSNHKKFGWSRDLEMTLGNFEALPENTFYGEFDSINEANKSFTDLTCGADRLIDNKPMVRRAIVVQFTTSRSFSDDYDLGKIGRES